MWIEKRANHRFKFVEQYKDPLTDKYRRVCVTFNHNNYHTRKQAHLILSKRINQRLVISGDQILEPKIMLIEVVHQWLDNFRPRVKFNTYRNNVSRAKNIIKALGKDTIITRINSYLLTNYFDRLIYVHHYKNSTVQKFRGTLNNIFKFAIQHRYLNRNPLKNVQINYRYNYQQNHPEQNFLDDEELKAVLSYMYQRSPHYGRFCEFLYLTGLRYGEAASLYPKNIYPNSHGQVIAAVRGTLVQGKKQPSPKTTESIRDVVLPEQAVQLCINEMKSHHSRTKFVFTSDRGKPLGNTVLNTWLHHAKHDLCIHKHLSVHTFRHTHISKLAELGVPLYLIQARVGHKDAQTTKEIYLHVTKRAELILDNKLNQL
ncbi:tyrosine-type recombinase/integrase [Limosilactobacillus frumenti]|uniref:tyrosine-type recombinase/integrase n=1 Tax=Limosilactobacillus frumenti TaxID=104955 RepID=UPI0015EC610C|nr:site-specific integrase [Limosilactobacillus frumenti]MBA2913871.1 site-specific integrase [Limosilactobacillus frumenti]